MSAAKYYCFVNENERTVEVRPKIRATDLDEGEAGKILTQIEFKICVTTELNCATIFNQTNTPCSL